MTTTSFRVAAERTETRFDDYKPAMSPAQAVVEANRCLYCFDAPCTQACPTEIDVPGFIRKIATGNLKGAARTILSANILGMSCARVCPVEVLCAGACVYNKMATPPIEIGRLQRHATDWVIDSDYHPFVAGPESGKRVALVGAGPASLAAAHALRRAGHACTLFERRDILGGLNSAGIAPYKLRADRAGDEIDWLLKIGGIDIETGVEVGKEPTWQELEARFDAIFLGLGLGADQTLEVDGAELPGVQGAVATIEQLKLGVLDVASVRHAAVIGGGNTAVDAVRELLGLGIANVTLLYRRGEESMKGYAHEWDAAKKQGARAVWRSLPTAFAGDGRLQRLHATYLDTQRRPIPGSAFTLEVELALMAIGQERLGAVVAGLEGVTLKGGRIVTDAGGATGRPGVFAGGDCVNGGKEVVNAVHEGARAADNIDRYLREGSHA